MSKNEDEGGFWIDVFKVRIHRLEYDKIAYILKDLGLPVFISIGRKTAYYARKRLSELVGHEVTSSPCQWGRQRGYIFFVKNAEDGKGFKKGEG